MEADLQRFHGVDLGDLWRGGLSVRRLSVLLAHLPPGSAVWAIENDLPYGWTLTDVLLTDLFHAFTGQPHPARPKPSKKGLASRAGDLRERLREQAARLANRSPS